MAKETNTLLEDWLNASHTFVKHTPEICRLHLLNNLILPENTLQYMALFLENSLELLTLFPQIRQTVEGPSVEKGIKDAYKSLIQSTEAGTQTLPPPPPPEPPVQPTYASIACMAEPATNTAPATTPNPSKPKWGTPPRDSPPPTTSQPRARDFKPSAQTATTPPKHTLAKWVQLVALIAKHPNPFSSTMPRWKSAPIKSFPDIAKEVKAQAPGCALLGLRPSRTGNLIMSFTPHSSPTTLLSKLDNLRKIFELSPDTPILHDTPWSTIHIANIPTRTNEEDTVFDQTTITKAVLTNPIFAGLALTSPPKWLRHSSKITGPRSSVVLSIEDPSGTLAQTILNTPLFMFGSPVRVKPWLPVPPPPA
ncbi:hypothetical protein BN14_10392 [Rhizoctonia solani AG-1 IB]|nr:hypothetical protein BN14_10392 [Rhizoctonia solani AG-1 IB]